LQALVFRDDPIFRREINLPKRGRRREELHTHLRFPGLHVAEINYPAFLRLMRGAIGHKYFLIHDHLSG